MFSLCVLLTAFPAAAEGPFTANLKSPAAPITDWKSAGSVRFYQGHFLPELDHELSKIGPLALTNAGAQPISKHVLYDDYTRQARRRMERATQDAVQEYLLETTSLGKLEEIFSSKSGPGTSRRSGGSFSVGMGISSGVPQVEMRYKMFTSTVRVSIGAKGEAKIDFKTRQMGQTHLVTRFDPGSGEYGLSYRLGF